MCCQYIIIELQLQVGKISEDELSNTDILSKCPSLASLNFLFSCLSGLLGLF